MTDPLDKKTSPWQNSKDVLKSITLWAFILSILITGLVCYFKKELTQYAFNYYCVKPRNGFFAEKIVYKAFNTRHEIKVTANKKEEFLNLLSNIVILYGKKRYKEQLHIEKSNYDCFCFSEPPEYKYTNQQTNEFDLIINGFHKFRNPTENVIQLERISAKITNGKIDKLNRMEDNIFENNNPDQINTIYNYPSFSSFSVVMIICFVLVGGYQVLDKSEWVRNIPVIRKIFK